MYMNQGNVMRNGVWIGYWGIGYSAEHALAFNIVACMISGKHKRVWYSQLILLRLWLLVASKATETKDRFEVLMCELTVDTFCRAMAWRRSAINCSYYCAPPHYEVGFNFLVDQTRSRLQIKHLINLCCMQCDIKLAI